MFLTAVVVVLVFLASMASAKEEKTPATSHSKVSRLEKTAKKWESQWKELSVVLGERLNINWSKTCGIHLFSVKTAIVGLEGSKKNAKIVYYNPERPKIEVSLDYQIHKKEATLGYFKKF
jgi:hypothetical protein